MEHVISNVYIIAANTVVSYYLNRYFNNLNYWVLEPMFMGSRKKINDFKKTKNTPTFSYMARMDTGKGVEYLAEILDRISNHLSVPIELNILGKTTNKFSADSLSKLIQHSKSNKKFNIHFHGWADEYVKYKILRQSNVFLYPSHYDTQAIVIHEAISAGLPCIVWDVLFTKINYSSTKVVLRVPVLDYDSFAEAAVYALKNKTVLEKNIMNFVDSFKDDSEVAELNIQMWKEITEQ